MSDSTKHVFTPGELVLRERAQQKLELARMLLMDPLKPEHVRTALIMARTAVASLEYLGSVVAGQRPPVMGEE